MTRKHDEIIFKQESCHEAGRDLEPIRSKFEKELGEKSRRNRLTKFSLRFFVNLSDFCKIPVKFQSIWKLY